MCRPLIVSEGQQITLPGPAPTSSSPSVMMSSLIARTKLSPLEEPACDGHVGRLFSLALSPPWPGLISCTGPDRVHTPAFTERKREKYGATKTPVGFSYSFILYVLRSIYIIYCVPNKFFSQNEVMLECHLGVPGVRSTLAK